MLARMFKCRQCGRGFGANLPAACPACGAEQPGPERVRGWRWVVMLLIGGWVELVVIAVLAGIIAAAALRFLL